MAGRNTVEIILSASDQASRTVRDAFGNLESSSSKAMGAVKAGAAIAVAAMVAVAGAVAKVGVDYNAMMEQSQVAWGTILGSQEKAKTTLKELQQMGAKTPYEFEGLDKSAKLLEMAGFHGGNLFTTLTKVGDAVSAVGGNDEVLQGVSMALYQMSAKGKISAQEMNQMAERGIPAWQMLADGMHKSVPELMKMSEQGKLLAKDAIPMMVDAMGTKFKGSMDAQSKTFNGMMSTMKDNLKILAGELSKPLFDQMKKGLEVVLPMLDGITSLAKGDMKGFSDTMKNTFGGEVGGAITQFVTNLGKGFQLVGQYVDKGKQALSGIFNIFTGNLGKGVSILNVLGFSDGTIQQIISVVDQIKSTLSKFFSAYVEVARFELENLIGFFKGAWGAIKGLFSGDNALGQSFAKIFNTIKSIVMPILNDVVAFIKDKFSMIKQFWDENGAQIIQAVKNFVAVLAAIFKFIAPVILFILKMLWDNVKGVIDGALKIIMGLIKVFAGLFTGDFGKMWEGIKQIFFGAIQAVWNLINLLMFGRILGGIKAFVVKSGEFFTGFGTKAVEIFKNLDTYLFDFVNSMFSKIIGVFKGFVDQGVSNFNTLRTFGASIFESLWAAIRTVSSNIASGVKGFFLDMYTGAKFHMDGLLTKAQSIFNSVKDAITNPIDTAKTLVGKAIDAIKGFFTNMKVKIPVPQFDLSTGHKDVAGISIPYPKLDVSWHDKGGVFYGPQVIGVGEKRPEFVGALDDLRKIVREETGSNGKGNTYNFYPQKAIIDKDDIIRSLQRLEVLHG